LLVEVDVEPGANDDSPIALSMLITHDRTVMEELLTLDATQWFARREQYLRDHEASIDEVMREYVPGQRVTPFWQRLRSAASEGVLFARYRAPGSHRYRFKATRPVRLVLGHSSVIVSNL
jgi:type VI secretion system protein